MSGGKRLFVGARVSVQTANALAAAAETLQRRAKDANVTIKWVAPANYHVTLKFLGWTRDDAIGAVRDAVDEALAGISSPIKFRCARLGAFPSLEKASVLWAGVDNALDDVAVRIDRALAGIGFVSALTDRRKFHAHVTLGRLRETRSIRELVLPLSEQMFSDTRIDGVTVFESETKPSGSVYRDLHRVAFKTASNTEKRHTGAVELGDDTDDGWPRGHQGS